MNLEILTPEKKLFSGEVYGVQLPGITGWRESSPFTSPMRDWPILKNLWCTAARRLCRWINFIFGPHILPTHAREKTLFSLWN